LDIHQLQARIQQGESAQLEFKKSTAQLTAVGQTLCGFLNGHGGTVLIGVTAEGQLLGQQVSDATQQEIAGILKKLEPAAHIEVNYMPIAGDKMVISLHAHPAVHHVPYSYDGRAYERIESTTSLMPRAKYQKLLLEGLQINQSWENLPAVGVPLSSLNEETIRQTIRAGIRIGRIAPSVENADIQIILRGLTLLKGEQLTNAAVVLYGTAFLPDYPQCQLLMARFRGTTKREFIDNQQTFGNLFQLLDEALLFLSKHLFIAGRIVEGQLARQEELSLPLNALREALVNACCHRDYSVRGGSVSLAIFDNAVEIWSVGSLPFGQQIQDLKRSHTSQPRNPLIADVLYRQGLIEHWGRGTQDIIDYCLAAGHPEPEFIESGGAFCVRFTPKIPLGLNLSSSGRSMHRVHLSKRQKDILNLLIEHRSLPLREILALLENPPAPDTVYDDLNRLKELGFISTIGHGRGATWNLIRNNGE